MIVIVPTELQQLSFCCCNSGANNLNWICIFVDCFFRFFLILGHPSWWWDLGAGSTGNCWRGWQYFAQPGVQLSSVDRSDWSRFQQKWLTVHWWISGNCFSKQCTTSKFKKKTTFQPVWYWLRIVPCGRCTTKVSFEGSPTFHSLNLKARNALITVPTDSWQI